MKITFSEPRKGAPEHQLAEAELILEDPDMVGVKINGVVLWRGKQGGGCFVTLPSRKSGEKFWDYIRPVGGDWALIKALKGRIVAAYEAEHGPQGGQDEELF
jgi:DNA-binding cell septation regulator SpoVG